MLLKMRLIDPKQKIR